MFWARKPLELHGFHDFGQQSTTHCTPSSKELEIRAIKVDWLYTKFLRWDVTKTGDTNICPLKKTDRIYTDWLIIFSGNVPKFSISRNYLLFTPRWWARQYLSIIKSIQIIISTKAHQMDFFTPDTKKIFFKEGSKNWLITNIYDVEIWWWN